jgi:hypothetical protein
MQPMFAPLTIPYGAVMLYNVAKLKVGVSADDVELAIGELCNVVKNTYGDETGGFIGGQVFKYTGFVSAEGSFESHADRIFKEKFSALAEYCSDTYEIGYEMLWQGSPEQI